MDVTLMFFADCPNRRVADQSLRAALARAGHYGVHVEHRLVTTPEQAAAAAFRGSPTVLVDGRDPFADPEAPVGMSCRVHDTDGGALAGAPTIDQLLAVLR